jgi:hypothetical protein
MQVKYEEPPDRKNWPCPLLARNIETGWRGPGRGAGLAIRLFRVEAAAYALPLRGRKR